MPRARLLRPEHRSHRKVGPLSHLCYRIWVGMILEADDEGRLTADPLQIRGAVLPFATRTTLSMVEASIHKLASIGLISLYEIGGNKYAFFPSWHDWQKPRFPTPSKIPPPPITVGLRKAYREGVGGEGRGGEGRGEKKKEGAGDLSEELERLQDKFGSRAP